MNIYTPPVREWVDPLRNFTLGTSMASLFLVPTAGYPIGHPLGLKLLFYKRPYSIQMMRLSSIEYLIFYEI